MLILRLRCMTTLILTVALLFSLASSAVLAQTPEPQNATPDARPSRAFEIYPAETGFGTYFSPQIDAGSSQQLTLMVGNTGDMTQDIRVFPVNAFTAPGGGFAAADDRSSPNEVTSWLDLSEQVFTIEPGRGIKQAFTVRVPDDTRPGEYLAAIAGEHADPFDVEGTDVLAQKLRYIIPVLITVPGETIAGFEVGDITATTDSGSTSIAVELENTGDVRVRPQGEISIIDANGKPAVSIPVEMESIYAHDGTTLTVGTSQALPPGDYTVEVDLSDKETKTKASGSSDPVHIDLAATPVPQTISITSATIEPGPDADNVQFAVVDATISNSADPVTNAQLSLLVSKDGEDVERFPISQSLALPGGDTEVNTRYIPLDGWSSGEWTFELLLETVEGSGAAVVVASQPIEGSITIP